MAALLAEHDPALRQHFLRSCSSSLPGCSRGADLHNSFVSADGFVELMSASKLAKTARPLLPHRPASPLPCRLRACVALRRCD